MRHKVTNEGIYVWINFDSVSDWNVGRGRALVQHILRQFKSHLNGYEPLRVKGYQYNSFWEDRKKKMVEYHFPLNLEKFEWSVFNQDPDYLNYSRKFST